MAVHAAGQGAAVTCSAPAAARAARRASCGIAGGVVAGGAAAVRAAVPMPLRTQAEGVVWLPEQADRARRRERLLPPPSRLRPARGRGRRSRWSRSVDPALDAQVRAARRRASPSSRPATPSSSSTTGRAPRSCASSSSTSRRRCSARVERAAALLVRGRVAGALHRAAAPPTCRAAHRAGRGARLRARRGRRAGRARGGRAGRGRRGGVARRARSRCAWPTRSGACSPGRIVRQVPAGATRCPSQALAVHRRRPHRRRPARPAGPRARWSACSRSTSASNEPLGRAAAVRPARARALRPSRPSRWRCRPGARCGGCSCATSMSERGACCGLAPRDLAPGRPYAERDEREPPWHDELALALWHGVALPLWRACGGGRARRARRRGRVRRALRGRLAALRRRRAARRRSALRAALRRRASRASRWRACFALVREAGGRVLGKRHYDSQLLAGWLLLQGTLVEMATGEGKTFAATLPAVHGGAGRAAGARDHRQRLPGRARRRDDGRRCTPSSACAAAPSCTA